MRIVLFVCLIMIACQSVIDEPDIIDTPTPTPALYEYSAPWFDFDCNTGHWILTGHVESSFLPDSQCCDYVCVWVGFEDMPAVQFACDVGLPYPLEPGVEYDFAIDLSVWAPGGWGQDCDLDCVTWEFVTVHEENHSESVDDSSTGGGG